MVSVKLAALTFCACAILRGADGPQLLAGNVVNAADYRAGAVAPSEILVLYPSNAGPPDMVAWNLDDSRATPILVDSLGETRVLFDNIPAPIIYTMKGQICTVVPYEVATRKTTEVVVEYQGVRSPPVTIPVVPAAPALFTLDASGAGQAAMLNETGCCNSVRNPAVQGTIASLYATGEGRKILWHTAPMAGPGRLPGLPQIEVTVGSVPAKIVWAGNLGLLQVNFRVPLNAPVGDTVPLVLTVGGVSSPAVTMAVRQAKQQILVVSGEALVRSRLKEMLTGAGYGVLTAAQPSEALEKSQGPFIDLVISDLAVPAGENQQMIDTLRQSHPQLKVAALT